MENLFFEYDGQPPASPSRQDALVGVVGSGNLEVLVERQGLPTRCTVNVQTAAVGFQDLWQAVLDDFIARHATGGLALSIHDGGARPDSVSLRLAQALKSISTVPNPPEVASNGPVGSWFEASARERISILVDPGSFIEFLDPLARESSVHLAIFDLPSQFDDGIVVGAAKLNGKPILLAVQEGRYMGGAFGEVHGAKLTGLLRAGKAMQRDVVIAFDTGGVRLQEANAGELAIAEIMRAVVQARSSGVRVIGLIGGRSGCYGGGGLIAGCCSTLVVSEPGRISVSGPEVIETNKGVEEFDSRDRALIWRTMGGKHRYLMGGADKYVDDDPAAGHSTFRSAAIEALASKSDERSTPDLNVTVLKAEQRRLDGRLKRFGLCRDGRDIWQEMNVPSPASVPDMPTESFLKIADKYRENADGAR